MSLSLSLSLSLWLFLELSRMAITIRTDQTAGRQFLLLCSESVWYYGYLLVYFDRYVRMYSRSLKIRISKLPRRMSLINESDK